MLKELVITQEMLNLGQEEQRKVFFKNLEERTVMFNFTGSVNMESYIYIACVEEDDSNITFFNELGNEEVRFMKEDITSITVDLLRNHVLIVINNITVQIYAI